MRSYSWFFRSVASSKGALLITVFSLSCGDDSTGPSGGSSGDLQQAAQSITEAEVATYDGMVDSESVVATVGSGGGGNFMEGGPGGPEAGRVNLAFVDYQYRDFFMAKGVK